MSAHDELDEIIWRGDPIAGEGDTRTDPYFAPTGRDREDS